MLLSGGTAGTVLLTLLMSYVLGQIVAWIYIWTHQGLTYSRNMIHSIVLLPMIVSGVILVVGDSLARAFGLVGALAIIRFRTVVRDARDTTFIFLGLSVGIAVGCQHHTLAVVMAVVIGMAAALLHFSGFATRYADAGVLRLRSSAGAEQLQEVLADWCAKSALLATREGAGQTEYSFEIRLFDAADRDAMLAAVRAVQGTTQVSVAMEERAEEW